MPVCRIQWTGREVRWKKVSINNGGWNKKVPEERILHFVQHTLQDQISLSRIWLAIPGRRTFRCVLFFLFFMWYLIEFLAGRSLYYCRSWGKRDSAPYFAFLRKTKESTFRDIRAKGNEWSCRKLSNLHVTIYSWRYLPIFTQNKVS